MQEFRYRKQTFNLRKKNAEDYLCILSKDLVQRIIVMLKSFSIVQMVYSIEYLDYLQKE